MDKADGVIQMVVIVLGIGALVVACSLFKFRERANILSPEELDEVRIRRESAKEAALEEKALRLKERARIHRHNRMVLTGRKNTGRLLESAQELWDARGRSIYGDAWDAPGDEILQLRTLFNLPKEEIDALRQEARRLLDEEMSAGGITSLPSPPNRHLHVNERRKRWTTPPPLEDGQRTIAALADRGSLMIRPSPSAPCDHTRSRDLGHTGIVPPLDFARLRKTGSIPTPRAIPSTYQVSESCNR